MSISPKLELGDRSGLTPKGPRARVRMIFFQTPATCASTLILLLIVIACAAAPLITHLLGTSPYAFNEGAVDAATGGIPKGDFGGISGEHLLGVEPKNGRDLLARILYGGRISLLIAACATVLCATIGITLGLVAGFYQGAVDQMISRIMDVFMAFPALIFMIAILSALPQTNRVVMLIIVLSLFSWPQIARVVRGQVLSVKQREYVEAATAAGASRWHLIFREILPNVSGSIIVMVTLMIPNFIATEAGLSFLGVGMQPPEPSWGQMIFSAVPWFATAPFFFLAPGIMLTLTILTSMVIGDRIEQVYGKEVS